jgi:RHS repeat-associated protein
VNQRLNNGFYTGKKIDRDTGLYYFNARWYDPELGRFITEDPVKDGVNWFSYVANNPLRYTDSTGLRLDDDLEEDYRRVQEKAERETRRKQEDRKENKSGVDSVQSRNEAYNNLAFDSENPINQHDFDSWYNLADTFKDSESCFATSMINLYGSETTVPKTAIDNVMAMDNNGLSSTGTGLQPNKFLALLGKELGGGWATAPLQITGETTDKAGFLTLSPRKTPPKYGLAKMKNPETNYTHWNSVYLSRDGAFKLDSLDPNRPQASQYNIERIYIVERREVQ